jgi:hypothetical protein
VQAQGELEVRRGDSLVFVFFSLVKLDSLSLLH